MVTCQVAMAEDAGDKQVFSTLPFQLVQQHGSSCMQVVSKDFELNSCIYNDPVTGKCYSRNRAVMKSCVEGAEEQNWFHDSELKRLHLSGYPRELCLTRMVRSVEMQPCIKEGNIAQQWYFTEDGLLKSLADTRESGSFLYAVENQELTLFHLKYQFTAPDLESGQCYVHPVTRILVCTEGDNQSAGEESGEGGENNSGEGRADNAVDDSPLAPEPPSEESNSSGDDSEEGSDNGASDQKPDDDKSGETIVDDQEPPKKPKPKYWLSKRLTPLLSLQGAKGRCLSLMLPDGCSPSADDESSRACLEGVSVNPAYCMVSETQQWQLDLKTQKIYNSLSGYDLCLTLKNNGLFMEGCFVNAEDGQRWYFSKGGRGSYGQQGLLRTRVNGLRTPYLYTERLSLPAGMSSSAARLKYEIVPNQSVKCFHHPLTGAALGGSSCK